ncbi:MAG: hypothetical protein WCG95_03875 [bacterium]
MSRIFAKKVSVSLPEDIIDFIDEQGENRSKTLVTIIQEYKSKKEEEQLKHAYTEYSAFYKDDGECIDEAVLSDLRREIE